MALKTGKFTTQYAILSAASAAAMLAAGFGFTPAYAADLGGNCCADLEERVAELEATSARKGNRRVSLTISGQVTTAVMGWDDGDRSDAYIVENVEGAGSYFKFNGNAKINPNLTAGFDITIALDTGGRSHQVTSADDDGSSTTSGSLANRAAGGFDSDIVLTLANWYLDHKQLGRITVGRINTASAGAQTVDLGGAGVIANSQVGYWQRSFTAVGSNFTWANLEGGNTVNGGSLSRANAIRYDTPTIGGFSLAVAAGEQNEWDAAIRYAGEFSGFRLAAALAYESNVGGLGDFTEDVTDSLGNSGGSSAGGAKPTQWNGSASIMHVATGLYLTGAYVNQDWDTSGADNTTMWYVQGGIAKNWTGLGNTTLYGEYEKVNDAIADGKLGSTFTGGPTADTTVWGLGVVQAIDAASMDLFLAYRQYSSDVNDPEIDIKDFNVVMGGARIRF
jgi:hypothetical protein